MTNKDIESLRECYSRDDPYVGKGGVDVTGGVPSEISVGIDWGHYESQEDVAAAVAGSLWRDHTKIVRMLLDHIAELQAIVEKLPRTTDDVPVIPQVDSVWLIVDEAGSHWLLDEVWLSSGIYKVLLCNTNKDWIAVILNDDKTDCSYWNGPYYSSEAAAEAAQEAGG